MLFSDSQSTIHSLFTFSRDYPRMYLQLLIFWNHYYFYNYKLSSVVRFIKWKIEHTLRTKKWLSCFAWKLVFVFGCRRKIWYLFTYNKAPCSVRISRNPLKDWLLKVFRDGGFFFYSEKKETGKSRGRKEKDSCGSSSTEEGAVNRQLST